MNILSILYVGPHRGTCRDRANALRRLGHRVLHVSLRDMLPKSVWIDRLIVYVGGHIFASFLIAKLRVLLGHKRFDLVYVDNGELTPPAMVKFFRRHSEKVINYNIDDPTGYRDRNKFKAYRMALSSYDVVAVVRNENLPECIALGARRAIRVWRSADEINHRPRVITPEILQRYQSEVLFLGTWMPGRGRFLLDLVEAGVPLTICGSSWSKAPEWPQLQRYWRSDELTGDDYAYALQCAKICLGLLSKGNRDQHTTRSLEIPALGSLLCAERTPEHQAMYDEGTEAVFWSSSKECAEKCLSLLSDEPRRRSIAEAGRARFGRNRHWNEDILEGIIGECFQ